jgi:hypothetical protein
MRLPNQNHDENATNTCFNHVIEDQNYLESCCQEYCPAPTFGCNETHEQAAEKIYVCILDQKGKMKVHKNIPNDYSLD